VRWDLTRAVLKAENDQDRLEHGEVYRRYLSALIIQHPLFEAGNRIQAGDAGI
jgi:hypothetical protein